MKKKGKDIEVLLPPDRNAVDVEMYLDGELVGLLTWEGANDILKVYADNDKNHLTIRLEDFEELLSMAKERLAAFSREIFDPEPD
jgi:hypothetical protein